MFSTEPMARIQLLLLTRDARAVLCQLGSAGILHLDEQPDCQDGMIPAGPERNRALARVEQLAARLARLREILAPFTPPAGIAEETVQTVAQLEERIRRAEEQLGDLPEQRRQQAQLLLARQAACAEAELLRDVNRPAETPEAPGLLHFVLGSLPTAATLPAEITRQSVLIPLAMSGDRRRMIIISRRSAAEPLAQQLAQAGFQPAPWETGVGLTAAGREELQRACAQAQANLLATTEQIRQIAAAFASGWGAAAATLAREQCLLNAETRFPRTEATTLISGWVPQAALPGLKQALQETTGGNHLLAAAAPAGSAPSTPVLITPSALLRPFAALVRAFGLPHYGEADPTLFVAVSYVLMFGMMFGDAGHGLLLLVPGLFLLAKRRTEKLHDAGVLLTGAGGASIFFGIVYGSFFGLDKARPWALWHDPLAGDPARLMRVALCAGCVMITLGVVLNIFNRIRRHDLPAALLGGYGVAGLLFYWGALVVLTHPEYLSGNPGRTLTAWLTLTLPVAGWILRPSLTRWWRNRWARGRNARTANRDPSYAPARPTVAKTTPSARPPACATDATPAWPAELAESLVAAFETLLSYLANTVSFVRLAAYAMSHAALLLAVILLADAVRGWPGGTAWAAAVLVFGNLGALALEGLIAAMQALRLEYYEFFSKFHDGGGTPFTPFRLPEGPLAKPL